MFEELRDAGHAIMKLHNNGCEMLRKRYGKLGVVTKQLSISDIGSVIVHVAQTMADYNLLFRVYPERLDFTKVLTFTAAALKEKFNDEFSAVPLFYAYIDFLDSTYAGTGMTLRSFGESHFYAENLEQMLRQKQWMAPFSYFRAIDLSFDKCAIPAVEALKK